MIKNINLIFLYLYLLGYTYVSMSILCFFVVSFIIILADTLT